MKKIVFLTLMFFLVGAEASEMRVYSFTADFIQCVSEHEADNDGYVMPGRSESSLMNGTNQLSGPLGDEYWGYMDCLSKSRGGTSNQNIEQSNPCPEVNISTSRGSLYIPPGQEGKRVGVSGTFWECSAGNWSRIGGSNIGGEIAGVEPPLERRQDCGEDAFSYGQCTFLLEASSHGAFETSDFGPVYGHDGDYEGQVTAFCRDGSFEIVEKSCSQTNCQPGETVSWTGSVNKDGRTGFCEAEVNYNGVARMEAGEHRYFSSAQDALEKTRKTSGMAKFSCSEGRWVLSGNAQADCQVKNRSELSCSSVLLGGKQRKYFCE